MHKTGKGYGRIKIYIKFIVDIICLPGVVLKVGFLCPAFTLFYGEVLRIFVYRVPEGEYSGYRDFYKEYQYEKEDSETIVNAAHHRDGVFIKHQCLCG